MSVKILLKYIVFVGMFFALAHTVFASFEITEIMYDLSGTDTDHEWVEVHNTGSTLDDLSKWYLFSDNTKHSLAPQSSSMVEGGGYAIITQNVTKFKTDWPNFGGLLFDSSWTGFNNEGETIALKDPDLNIISSITYNSSQGGSGDGNSLQKIDGVWKGAVPTPGLANQSESNSSNSGNNSSQTLSSSSSADSQSTTTQALKKETEIPKITTDIISKNLVFANISFPIESITLGHSREALTHGKFVWNLGDGTAKEEIESKPFEYFYQYPGEYVVTLSYYQNYYSIKPDATDRMIIKAVPSEIAISSVGDNTDPFVELENKSTYEIPLSKWILKGLNNSFIIPEGTLILQNKKLKLSSKITGFNSEDITSIMLQNPTGEISAAYPLIPIAKSSIKSISANNSQNYVSDVSANNTKPDALLDKTQVIDLNNLGASAENADIKNTRTALSFMGLGGIIILGVASIFVIRRKNTIPDYLEQDLRAEDMTIVE
jgi:hypothetical protein